MLPLAVGPEEAATGDVMRRKRRFVGRDDQLAHSHAAVEKHHLRRLLRHVNLGRPRSSSRDGRSGDGRPAAEGRSTYPDGEPLFGPGALGMRRYC